MCVIGHQLENEVTDSTGAQTQDLLKQAWLPLRYETVSSDF